MSSSRAVPLQSEVHLLAEGPAWEPGRRSLHWVDIESGEVLAGTVSGTRLEVDRRTGVDRTVGAAVPSAEGRTVVAGRGRLFALEPDGTRTPGPTLLREEGRRLNDGACDPAGRFVVGSMVLTGPGGNERLVRLEDDGSVTTLDGDLTLSNGLAWSPDGTVMYSVDTVPGTVWRRPYDPATGAVGPRTEHLHVTDGSPDGMCADTAGNLWIAIWGAGQVRCYSPAGEVLHVVQVDAPQVTSVIFVGHALDRLVITTASVGLDPRQDGSGLLFTADVPATGGVCCTGR